MLKKYVSVLLTKKSLASEINLMIFFIICLSNGSRDAGVLIVESSRHCIALLDK